MLCSILRALVAHAVVACALVACALVACSPAPTLPTPPDGPACVDAAPAVRVEWLPDSEPQILEPVEATVVVVVENTADSLTWIVSDATRDLARITLHGAFIDDVADPPATVLFRGWEDDTEEEDPIDAFVSLTRASGALVFSGGADAQGTIPAIPDYLGIFATAPLDERAVTCVDGDVVREAVPVRLAAESTALEEGEVAEGSVDGVPVLAMNAESYLYYQWGECAFPCEDTDRSDFFFRAFAAARVP